MRSINSTGVLYTSMRTITIPRRLFITGDKIAMPITGHIGFNALTRTTSLREHEHHCFELTYVFAGHVVWEIGQGRLLKLRGGDMALTQPHIKHRGRLNVIEPASFFWLHIDPDAGNAREHTPFSAAEITALKKTFVMAGNTTSYGGTFLYDTLARLHDTLSAWQNRQTSVLTASLRSLLACVIAEAARRFSSNDAGRPSQKYIPAVRRYMEENIDRKISVDILAQYLGISSSRLHAVLKESCGISPMDYLLRLRIEKAKELLASPDASVTSVALDLGFSSSQYFATCYKKHTGMAPGAFSESRLR
ncbi:MAG: helix-turn-helix domain-containing protein [Chitinivibrionales bacterium]|nr:helix-turn-helix domain-containing protein [Chitinivibrionales bacterium]